MGSLKQCAWRAAFALMILLFSWSGTALSASTDNAASVPTPFTAEGVPVEWLFVFKLNASVFPSPESADKRTCPFGGKSQLYKPGQQYAFASSADPQLKAGSGLIGTSGADPLGATFTKIYEGRLHYVIWNDQFDGHPRIPACGDDCDSPWGHSKGILAWNDAGEGIVLQVTTPSWPAAADPSHPRNGEGNTLGCISKNNIKFSQHFFALKLIESDVENVLDALANASVGTDIADPELVSNGGPAGIRQRVSRLGAKSHGKVPTNVTLSSGVRLISKPSELSVPPWQMVSSLLGGIDLRTATWWMTPTIPSTGRSTPMGCWDAGLTAPGAVQVATTGKWAGKAIGLKAGANHAKIGISLSGPNQYSIFGDMNQQGSLAGRCDRSQNGRGGMFFVVDNAALHASIQDLIAGDTALVAATH